MKNSEIPQWNLLIDRFLRGDELPFFRELKFIIIHHHFFRGKSSFEIHQQYGIEPEDFFQERMLEIIRLDYLRRWKEELLSDKELNREIRGFIRNRLIDEARKKHLEITETEIIDLSGSEADEYEIIEIIRGKLDKRKLFIFENYRKFLGDDDVKTLACEIGVSQKTIEPEIKKIKEIIEKEFIKQSPYLKKRLKGK